MTIRVYECLITSCRFYDLIGDFNRSHVITSRSKLGEDTLATFTASEEEILIMSLAITNFKYRVLPNATQGVMMFLSKHGEALYAN